MKQTFIHLLGFIFSLFSTMILAQPSTEKAVAIVKTDLPPRIDGILNDAAWQNAAEMQNFRQYMPVFNADPIFASKVMVLYNNEAIYIGAQLTDPHPDSIARQLGERDNEDLNADYFGVGFDTYNNQQDAYYFMVAASGVQVDGRMRDGTYDAVWESAVKITNEGWNVEFRIPYSALRFPTKTKQDWGFQVIRKIRRYREEQQWALEEKGTESQTIYWGKLTGFENIKPPLRLSFTPYLSANLQHNSDPSFKKDPLSASINGGLDLKYGINESFTLDMILLPDFSQVQSDKIQKNLTALELVYDENRTFFNEGIDLFQKGDLFYSRRIGRQPVLYYNAYQQLNENEMVSNNPVASRLLNAVKVSGRTSSGLGLGLFNAITGNTWATLKDTVSNTERQFLTDPATNYNIVVADQALKNNSSVYLINTNVSRPSGYDDSNVTGGGGTFGDKSKTYFIGASFAASKWNKSGTEALYQAGKNSPGYNYGIFFMKSRGKFQFSIYQSALDKNFDINDMGINRTRNQENRGIYLSYRIYEPFARFMNFSQSFGIDQTRSLDSKKNIDLKLTYKGNTTFRNYLSVWWGLSSSPLDRYDFYEPRRTGRFYLNPGYINGWGGISSDYRKKLAIDGQVNYFIDKHKASAFWMEIEPILRLNDRFSLRNKLGIGRNLDDCGYVSQDFYSDSIFFGNRNIHTIENTLSGKYMFSRLISASLFVRHFWQQAGYNQYFTLETDGNVKPYSAYPYSHNYNYNYFSVDFMINWEFAPGSMLSIVWKNTIQNENELFRQSYFENLDNLFSSSQLNMFSIKALYHLDYLQLKRKK